MSERIFMMGVSPITLDDTDAPSYLQSLEHVAMWKRTDAMMKRILN